MKVVVERVIVGSPLALDSLKPSVLTVFTMIQSEVDRAKGKYPKWPTDPVHAAAIVAEEAGELVKACLELSYNEKKTNIIDVRDEAVQTAAMAIRFLQSLDHYEFKPSEQHEQ